MIHPDNRLTEKEVIAVGYMATGMRNKEIAALMSTTEQYIKNILQRAYNKTGCGTRLELALYWIQGGAEENGASTTTPIAVKQ